MRSRFVLGACLIRHDQCLEEGAGVPDPHQAVLQHGAVHGRIQDGGQAGGGIDAGAPLRPHLQLDGKAQRQRCHQHGAEGKSPNRSSGQMDGAVQRRGEELPRQDRETGAQQTGQRECRQGRSPQHVGQKTGHDAAQAPEQSGETVPGAQRRHRRPQGDEEGIKPGDHAMQSSWNALTESCWGADGGRGRRLPPAAV